VFVRAPSGPIDLNLFGDRWRIFGFEGFSNCVFSGFCDPKDGSCTNCTGADAPLCLLSSGIGNCTDNRPTCSVAKNTFATADAHVLCIQ
jgi:hypothetical protein